MKVFRMLLLLSALLTPVLKADAEVSIRGLDTGWRFRQASSEIWHAASVPGTVHTDLMANNLIDDPFFRLNERSVQWIDKEDWVYETSFTPTQEEWKAANKELVFKGLDTYADVYLNGEKIISADNMHREWRADVGGLLCEGENRLEVWFHSPVKINVPKWDALPYRHNTGPDQSQMGGIFDKTISVFARTAGFEYGWDWGPRLVTFGIWRPVLFETWGGQRISDVYHEQKDVTAKRAVITTYATVESDKDVPEAVITIKVGGRILASRKVPLEKGENTVKLDYTVKNPRLWWTNGLGEPYLYDFETTVETGGAVVDWNETKIGLRSLVLYNDPDSAGHNLYFELNGHPLFAKGSNVVPTDNFLPRSTDSVYQRLVGDARAVNMNMLRVWGGGIYEDDAFYKYCDEYGILVWQDFAFACGTWPADSAFLASVKQEAVDNVRRLRNHACIAVYAGNNESQDIWYGWGNKKKELDALGYGEEVGKMQRDLFYGVLPSVVSEYSPGTAYRPSCPWAFADTASDGINGDDHYWGVWHGAEPFEAFYDRHVRFCSEYGFQSFPEYESILKYAPNEEDHNIYSDVMMAHQKAGSYANHRIEEYMARDYRVPKDFKTFVYVGMLLQGDGIKTGMEAFRRDRPFCMGSLVWQINDCWPVASWSSRDYYGRWKALHYFTRKAYDDILVSAHVKDGDHGQTIDIRMVNDRLESVSGTLALTTMTLDGREVWHGEKKMTLPANDAADAALYDVNEILCGYAAEDVIFHITFLAGGKTYYNIAYAAKQKDMHYRRPDISVKTEKADNGYEMNLTSDVFARGVYLSIKGMEHFFSDNYFDILPGETVTVHLETSAEPDFDRDLEITTLGDTY